jgi:hypothetical protein
VRAFSEDEFMHLIYLKIRKSVTFYCVIFDSSAVIDWLRVPDTQFMLDQVRPDFLMLRVSIIVYNSCHKVVIMSLTQWLSAQWIGIFLIKFASFLYLTSDLSINFSHFCHLLLTTEPIPISIKHFTNYLLSEDFPFKGEKIIHREE